MIWGFAYVVFANIFHWHTGVWYWTCLRLLTGALASRVCVCLSLSLSLSLSQGGNNNVMYVNVGMIYEWGVIRP